MANHTLEVDVAWDCDHDTITKDYAQRHGCQVTLKKLHGPAGGNPLYVFTGTPEALTSLIRDFYDNVDVSYHVSRIK